MFPCPASGTFDDCVGGYRYAALRCERYARCVSLYGDGFEPLFDDNFFDLLPGETKCIRVLPSLSSGVIYAETAYDQTVVSCQWKKEKEK